MARIKHRVFISFHHDIDQEFKESLLDLNAEHEIFIDASVDTGEIDDSLDDQAIRQKIRDEYLQDSSVTIVLVGLETKKRKHVDWEIYSSMFDGTVNKQSGVLVINLPSTNCTSIHAAHGETEKEKIYPEYKSWTTVKSRQEYEERYPQAPARIIDNLLKNNAKVSVTSWVKISENPEALRILIDLTFDDRTKCEYDLSRPLRRADS